MPRPTVLIDQAALTSVINDLESKESFTNFSALCQKVCETDWAKGLTNSAGKHVTLQPQVVYSRIVEFKIPTITKAGKKGRVAGTKVTGIRTPRATKFAANALVQKSLADMRKTLPKSETGLINKIEQGSIKAMVKAFCRNCVAYEASLIGDASCSGCPLSPIVFSKLTKYKTQRCNSVEEQEDEDA